ncbi:MAG: hypothetical protein GY821_13690 [Gammaproteobacteria bacterium]|nr:hypothetical protein [Gammaproteobacteria bacterium]
MATSCCEISDDDENRDEPSEEIILNRCTDRQGRIQDFASGGGGYHPMHYS